MSFGSEITDEDLITFKRDGFVLKKGMYSAEEISLLHDIAKGEQYARALLSTHCAANLAASTLPVLTLVDGCRFGTGLAFASAQGVAEGRARSSSLTL